VELVVVPPSRLSSSSLEGRDVDEVREWVAQSHGMTSVFPHSTRIVPGMAAQCGLAERCRDLIPRRF
jgi:hypothetical protein